MADIEDTDIWRAAQQSRTLYRDDAGIEAAVRADNALYQGDIVGSEVWKRIRNAIGELERKTPKAGEALN